MPATPMSSQQRGSCSWVHSGGCLLCLPGGLLHRQPVPGRMEAGLGVGGVPHLVLVGTCWPRHD